MGEALFPDEATIYIVATGTAASALAASDAVTGEVINFSESGGEEDTESIPVFGGGNITKENPRSQLEVAFDVIPQYTPDAGAVTKWDAFKLGAGLSSSGAPAEYDIYVQWYDGASAYYTRGYRKCRAVSWSPSMGAEDYLQGSITFKLSPTQSDGTHNQKVFVVAATSATW